MTRTRTHALERDRIVVARRPVVREVRRPSPRLLSDALAEPGRPIDPAARAVLEDRFGRPLDHVRIRSGHKAAMAAKQVGAEAFTIGNDVVFGERRYDPHTRQGLELLAHEAAHTLQQQGLAATPLARLAFTEPGSTIEREADAAARAVLDPATSRGGACTRLVTRPAGPQISRRAIAWTPIPSGPVQLDDGQTVSEWELHNDQIARFKIDSLVLPREKGPVLEAYQAAVRSGGESSALETTLDFSGKTVRAGLWQSRADTSELNRRWLIKVGWETSEANAKWHAAGGKKGSGFPTRNPGIAGSTCDMDHIVELQLGGTNVPSNIAPLNSAENRKSGRDIWRTVSGIARTLRPLVPRKNGTVNVILSFQSVEQAGGAVPQPSGCCAAGASGCTCSQVDACAMEQSKAVQGAVAGREPYPVRAGASTAQFQVVPGDAPVDLIADQANIPSAELIPGMILQTLERPKRGHVVTATIESAGHVKRSKPTRLPIVLQQGKDEVKLDSIPEEGTYRLALKSKNQRVNFTYPYLSTGWMKLDLTDTGLVGDGELTPSIPILNRTKIAVHFGEGTFSGSVQADDPSKLRLPIPGFRVTRAALGITLAPELGVTGDLDFEIGRLVTGNLHAEPATSGILLKGTIRANIPKLEQTTGEVEYRNGNLSGRIKFRSEELANLPGSPQGELTLLMASRGLDAEGEVSLALPGGVPLVMTARRASANQILLTGRTSFRIPGLEPMGITISYNGRHFSGEASTGVTYKGTSGALRVKYWDGAFSGDTEARFAFGRVAGRIHIFLDSDGDLYGDGDATVRITKDVSGRIGLKKPKKGDVEVAGELLLPPKMRLFPKQAIDRTLFSRAFTFPVFGPVAVQVRPSIGFTAGVGEGSIDNARVGAGFKPFADDMDFEVTASGQLSIPGYVTVSVGLGLGVALSAGVGSIGGGVEVVGTLGLRGGVFVPFQLHYRRGVFTATADVGVRGVLVAEVRIKGYLLAELAGFEIWHPEWDLWGKSFDTGLEFLLIVPISYASDKEFRLPSVSEMTIRPEISLESLKAKVRELVDL